MRTLIISKTIFCFMAVALLCVNSSKAQQWSPITTDNLWYVNSGKVGLGTLNPGATLQIGTSNSNTGIQTVRICTPETSTTNPIVDAIHIDPNNNTIGKGIAISFGLKSNSYGDYTSRIIHYGNFDSTRASKLQLQTHHTNEGIWNTGLVIDEAGQVGIGTTTPSSMLEVNGKLKVNGNIYMYGSQAFAFQDDTRFLVDSATIPNLNTPSFSMPYYGIASPSAGGSAELWLSGANAVRLFTNGNAFPVLNIASSGNVGIGTINPNFKLDVAGDIASSGNIVSSGNIIAGNDLIVTRNNKDIGGTICIGNPAKNGAGQASAWKIYNMGGRYGNSLQFWDYDSIGCSSGGMCQARFTILDNGKIGIGTTTPDSLLTVKGGIHAKSVLIDLNGPLADYVFNENYNLMPLHKVEAFVKTNKHLPEIPSAAEITKNGLNMGEMQNKLLQKVEELTLYVIQQQKRIEQLENIIKTTQK